MGGSVFLSNAQASTYTGTVTEILMGVPYGNAIIIKVDGSPVQSGCHTNPGYNYAFDASTAVGKNMLSSILVAFSTQKVVTFYGAGDSSCTAFGGIENLDQFLLK